MRLSGQSKEQQSKISLAFTLSQSLKSREPRFLNLSLGRVSNTLMASGRDDPLSFITTPHSSSPITVSETDSYLFDNTQIGSASGSFQNEGFLGGLDGGGNSDAEFGFSRPDFRQSPLVGTVEYYDRHVFLCYKGPQAWPRSTEAAEFDRLPRLLAAALACRKGDMKRQTRLTICEGHDGTETSNGDVLIFPDMVRYRRLTHFDVDTFVEEVLVKDGEWLPGSPEVLRGWFVFVCCHGRRDRRCGVCGPAIISRFKEEIDWRGLNRKISVSPCSHTGGDKYAGNVIIFGRNVYKEVTGHWYGYVSPDDVPVLLEQHIGKGEIVDWLWRGQMGLSEEEQKQSQELRFRANGTNAGRGSENLIETAEMSPNSCGSHVGSSRCCQENGSTFCCQDSIFPGKDSSDITDEIVKFSAEKKSSRKQIRRSNSGKGSRSIPTWFETWEREDTYAALAVIGAVLSVAFAYNCYKHLH